MYLSNENNGFPSANNLVFRFAKNILGCEWFWVLGNDAVPRTNTFQALLEAASSPNPPEIFGTAVMEYYALKPLHLGE